MNRVDVKKSFSFVLGALLLSGLLMILQPIMTHALPNEGPTKNDGTRVLIRNSTPYGDSYPNLERYMEYVVSYDDYTDILQTDIMVYMPTRYGNIRVLNKDLCVNTSLAYQNSDANHENRPAGTQMATYRLLSTSGTLIDSGIGVWNYGAADTCSVASLDLTANAANASTVAVDPDTNMYIYRIRVNSVTGGAGGKFSNGFRIVAPAGSYVSQDSTSTANEVGIQPSYPLPPGNNPAVANPPDPYRVYTDIDLPFGPDCSLTTPTAVRTFDVYDGDNGNPDNLDTQPRPFDVQVIAFDRGSGASLGSVPLTFVGFPPASVLPFGGGDRWLPQGPNQSTVRFSFTVNRSYIYILRINRLYSDNTLQITLPYDSVFFYRPCQRALTSTVRPVATMSPAAAEVGSTVTSTASVQRVGATGAPAQVNYAWHTWYDNNRNGQHDAGDTVPAWFNGGATQTGSVNLGAGQTSFAIPPPAGRQGVADRPGRICTYLALATTNPNTNIATPNPSTASCTEIGKRPKMYVTGGDVMAGGTFRDISGTCPALPVPLPSSVGVRGSNVLTIGAALYSSYADYGVISLGQLATFGANGSAPTLPTSDLLHFGNTTSHGYFYSPGRGTPAGGNPTQARCLNDPFAIFGPRVSATTTSTTIDVATVGSSVRYTGTGTLRITASGPIAPGRKIIIDAPSLAVTSSVLIGSNIAYADGPYASINQLPQIVILSNRKITVENTVTRIDGIYAARTDFQTCNVAPQLDQCSVALTVNGAIIAGNRVNPFRTAGAQAPNYADKAETFRLRPDILLNQLTDPSTNTVVQTIEQREVPARF